jgi:hypothetical protein
MNKHLWGAMFTLNLGVAIVAGHSTAPWYFWVQVVGYWILSLTVPLTVDGIERRRRARGH